jgi:hypothetical protein
MRCRIVRPANTPNPEVSVKASVAPIQTALGSAVLPIPATAICVLSPNSASVINRNVLKKIP